MALGTTVHWHQSPSKEHAAKEAVGARVGDREEAWGFLKGPTGETKSLGRQLQQNHQIPFWILRRELQGEQQDPGASLSRPPAPPSSLAAI